MPHPEDTAEGEAASRRRASEGETSGFPSELTFAPSGRFSTPCLAMTSARGEMCYNFFGNGTGTRRGSLK